VHFYFPSATRLLQIIPSPFCTAMSDVQTSNYNRLSLKCKHDMTLLNRFMLLVSISLALDVLLLYSSLMYRRSSFLHAALHAAQSASI